jgi:hypothetical protein
MDSATGLRIGVALEALLLAPMLQPLARDFDAFGSYGLDLLATEIARRDAGGFAAALQARLSQAR